MTSVDEERSSRRRQGGGGGSDLAHRATFALALPAVAPAVAPVPAAPAAAAATVAVTVVLAVPEVADVDGKEALCEVSSCRLDGGGAPSLLPSLSPNSIAAHRMR